jgi:hypothetical protein
MATAIRSDQGVADELVSWLKSTPFGFLRAIAATAIRDLDAVDDEAWFFVVTIAAPQSDGRDPWVPSGAEQWSVGDIVDMDREFRDRAIEKGLSWPWYLSVRPETDDHATVDEE